MFKVIKKEGSARRGEFVTVHGTVQTPAFMNVATCGAIKGAVSALDLKNIKCQVQLCNTYHLHLRPGDEKVKQMGGLHKFTRWNGPILTDSGGFQVFSLAKLRNIKEEGVYFNSHIDGRKIFMGPEESMQIQSNLASTIAMAFDECIENPAPYDYVKRSCDRTYRWLVRCKAEMQRLQASFPAELSATLTYDASQYVSGELHKIYLRTLLCVAILLLFVYLVSRDFRYLLIITVTLVVNILIAVVFYNLLRLDIHIYTLAGITVSLGIIIDTSIIMVDHYSYYRDRRVFVSILGALLMTIGALGIVWLLPEEQQDNLTAF